MADATVTQAPDLPLMPTPSKKVEEIWFIRATRAINHLLRGKATQTMRVTLAANATTSNIYDSRIGPFTCLAFMPTTTSAQAARLSTAWNISLASGIATVNHASNAATDQTFIASISG